MSPDWFLSWKTALLTAAELIRLLYRRQVLPVHCTMRRIERPALRIATSPGLPCYLRISKLAARVVW